MVENQTNQSGDGLDDLLGTGGSTTTATTAAPSKGGRKGGRKGKAQAEAELGVLDGSDVATSAPAQQIAAGYEVVMLDVESLHISPFNPRPDEPEEGDVKEMVKRIRATGGEIVNPIHVDTENGILAGRRRWAAYKAMGRKQIPAIVFDEAAHKYAASALALVEQDSTKPLSALQMARAIHARIEDGTWADQSAAARALGLSAGQVSRYMDLLNVSEPVRQAVESGRLSPTAAQRVAKLPEEQQVAALETLERVEAGKPITVKAVEKVVNQAQAENGESENKPRRGRTKMSEAVSADHLPDRVNIVVRRMPENDAGETFTVDFCLSAVVKSKTLNAKAFNVVEFMRAFTADIEANADKVQKGLELARRALTE